MVDEGVERLTDGAARAAFVGDASADAATGNAPVVPPGRQRIRRRIEPCDMTAEVP